ncbi:hypothetical protein PVAP13_1NG160719 [Panicum virgatum]|uniref:Uncharacterized protein n=1 Tax=Panicum virgatum TaxID=38727 RepID=A0A8T0WZU7_PANVG|nr:hypothetical protein PVAP13_1NG160719 [Panicum virgatum]
MYALALFISTPKNPLSGTPLSVVRPRRAIFVRSLRSAADERPPSDLLIPEHLTSSSVPPARTRPRLPLRRLPPPPCYPPPPPRPHRRATPPPPAPCLATVCCRRLRWSASSIPIGGEGHSD